MTLATDVANNSLIVTAPKQLADQVEQLAFTLDRQMQQLNEASAEVVRVIPSRNAAYVHVAIKRIQGEPIPDPKSKPSPPASPQLPPPNATYPSLALKDSPAPPPVLQ